MYKQMNTYDGVDLESKQTPKGRFYRSPTNGLWYPSVTTVTGYSKAKFFAEWRKNPENQKEATRAANRGTRLHTIIENHLNNEQLDETKETREIVGLFSSMKPYLHKIQNIYCQEKSLWSDKLRMAGRVDCIADYCGTPSVIDFKGSTKRKSEEYIQNYFEQTCCYSMMWTERTGKVLPQIVILIAVEDGTVQEFVKRPIEYVKQVKSSIQGFWKDHDFSALQDTIT
jgi:genome maintenance exonuclease 1